MGYARVSLFQLARHTFAVNSFKVLGGGGGGGRFPWLEFCGIRWYATNKRGKRMFNEINTADSQPLITKLFDFSKTCVVFITLFRWILRLHVEIHNPLFECKKKKKKGCKTLFFLFTSYSRPKIFLKLIDWFQIFFVQLKRSSNVRLIIHETNEIFDFSCFKNRGKRLIILSIKIRSETYFCFTRGVSIGYQDTRI